MIFYLFLSIIFATGLLIILKSFHIWKADTMHAIVCNYWTAASWSLFFGFLDTGGFTADLRAVIPFAIITGFFFIIVFFITGKTTQVAGVGTASVASKMSMIIPIVAGIILYNESIDLKKTLGILLAVPAVVLISLPGEGRASASFGKSGSWLPVLLFVGAGMVDTLIKFAQHTFITDENRNFVIMIIFGSAGCFGLARLTYELRILKKRLTRRSIAAGILLGTANYFSLHFLVMCLEMPGSESSTVFAYVNMGVVILSFFTGLVLFGEKAGKWKMLGLAMALSAIAFLSV
jgi:drug/metabolite transporter (DMT)-like permease